MFKVGDRVKWFEDVGTLTALDVIENYNATREDDRIHYWEDTRGVQYHVYQKRLTLIESAPDNLEDFKFDV